MVAAGISEFPASAGFNLYPVPNNGQFTASLQLPVDGTFTILVFNQMGERLYEMRDVKTVNGRAEVRIDLRPAVNGVFTVVLLNKDYKVVKRIMVNN